MPGISGPWPSVRSSWDLVYAPVGSFAVGHGDVEVALVVLEVYVEDRDDPLAGGGVIVHAGIGDYIIEAKYECVMPGKKFANDSTVPERLLGRFALEAKEEILVDRLDDKVRPGGAIVSGGVAPWLECSSAPNSEAAERGQGPVFEPFQR